MGEKLVLHYLHDLIGFITEMEQLRTDAGSLDGFMKNIYYKRASERSFLVMGEILNKVSRMPSEVSIDNKSIRNMNGIIGLRNLLAHAYDTVDHALLWGLIIKQVPELKEDVLNLMEKIKTQKEV